MEFYLLLAIPCDSYLIPEYFSVLKQIKSRLIFFLRLRFKKSGLMNEQVYYEI